MEPQLQPFDFSQFTVPALKAALKHNQATTAAAIVMTMS
jgi:hypothetical protein